MTPQEQNEIYEMLVRRANRPGTFTAVNGLRVTSLGDGCAEGEADLTDSHLNPLGIPHGGVYCTMMDQGRKALFPRPGHPHGPQHHRHAGLGH